MKKETKGLHPDHSPHKKRLNRIVGQLSGIEKMIDERRYCPDIITQIHAASKALEALGGEIMKTHIRGCVKSAIRARNEKAISDKINEIMNLVKKS